MKDILLYLAFTVCTLSYSQKLTYKMPTKEAKTFNFKNGANEYVQVKFRNYLKDLTPNNEILKKNTLTTMVKSKFKLKYKRTFVPLVLTLMPPNEGHKATAIVKYLGKTPMV